MSPKVVVAAIIYNDENKVLLCKSSKWNNLYVVPGGHVEFGESLEEALRREVFEETRLSLYDMKLIAIKEGLPHATGRHMVVFDYLCRTHDFEVVLNDEAEEFIWVDEAQVFELPLAKYTESFFRAKLSQREDDMRTIFYNV
ncbi:MAG: NUDIX domain-containing protein [Tissierellales bacterium]|nr:NUDIX domain-containing protein [Tissierellales bacterium]MBN2826782.1 NUDIX domain-containing protein [Tissierellales bacterium]